MGEGALYAYPRGFIGYRSDRALAVLVEGALGRRSGGSDCRAVPSSARPLDPATKSAVYPRLVHRLPDDFAVVVLVEEGPSGGEVAAPIAGRLLRALDR